MKPLSFMCLVLFLACAGWPIPARANGAFPEAGQLLFPAQRADTIVIGANYGLLVSEDRGSSWSWACETERVRLGRLYQTGVDDRLLALSASGLVYSDDLGCTWQASGGALSTALGTDSYVDASNPRRVFALATNTDYSQSVHVSHDGGSTFDRTILTVPNGTTLNGVESSRSNPDVVYVSGNTFDTVGPRAQLWRSTDGGNTWQSRELEAELLRGFIRIVSVDPVDPSRVLLRVTPTTGDLLALTRDGGVKTAIVARSAAPFSAFLRRESGELLLATTGTEHFRSTDAGSSFEPWTVSVAIRALAEREGTLYVVPDIKHPNALLRSDDGASFVPVFSLSDLRGPRPCVAAACQSTCDYYSGMGLWPAATCTARESDAGVPQGTPSSSDGGGCACTVPASARGGSALPWVCAGFALLRSRSRRTRHRNPLPRGSRRVPRGREGR